MTAPSPRNTTAAFTTPDEIAAAIRAAGGRFSASRSRVLDVLFAAEAPLSADQIYQSRGGTDGDLELPSIYRALDALEQIGAVRHLHMGHGAGRYCLTSLSGSVEYLGCSECGHVTSVPTAELDDFRSLIVNRFGYRPEFSHFPMIGVCAQCAQRDPQI